ncbi:MAG: hypothetical protein J7501_13095, partial [Bdellovibrio sp.]|nr:hypothetical protein [Bdellovibrio sp.]
MTKFIVSLALVAASSVASAKIAKTGSDYSSSSPSYSSYGAPQNEITTFLTRGFFSSEKACKDCSTGTSIDIGAAYNL